MSFPRYPKYKDSGVEWLGEVPEHWTVCSIRHCLVEMFNGLTADQVDETETTVPVTRIETISLEPLRQIDDERVGFIDRNDAREDRKLLSGDILFSNINSLNMIGNCGPPSIGERELYAGMNLLVLRPARNLVPRWLYWLIRSSVFREVVESLAKPAINQASLSQSSINSILVPVPLCGEQTAIAAFLDRETAKIDGLVGEQRRLIELLKEKRQAVISHAVTKGLNPNAPMKPSGIEWLGDVPEHWKVIPLKALCSLLKDGTHLPPARVDGGVPLLSVRNIVNGRFDLREDDSTISMESYHELCRGFIPQASDVLLAIVGATLGKTAIVPPDF